MNSRKIQYLVIPPEHDAEFVANMEDVLEAYERPYNPDQPLICMDEQPVQLIKETREPIPATENHPERVDYEYKRNGTASIFMFTEPLSGWREAAARPRRTKTDWAVEVARLLEGRYVECEKITLVCDNLNTHTKGAFYEAFSPDRARALVRRIEFCYTPKHGSWLNIGCRVPCDNIPMRSWPLFQARRRITTLLSPNTNCPVYHHEYRTAQKSTHYSGCASRNSMLKAA
jgi:hypothetical protein